MRIFVAGATGVLGQRAVRALVGAGHDVTGIARSDEKAELLRALGARPARVDLFDTEALRAAVSGHDAVLNLATHIPSLARAARAGSWDENTRIRTEGARNLVDTALAAGAGVYVQESIAFLYGDHGDDVIDAANTAQVDTPFTAPMRAAEAEAARFAAGGGRAVVLRFGGFVAAGSHHTDTMVRAARRGFSMGAGDRDGWFPQIHADDAASAVVAALDAPGGTYDVVDDEPLRRRDQDAALAGAVGRRGLRGPPAALTRKVAGPMADSQRVSNRAFRDATGWQPSYPSAREGWPAVAREMHVEPALGGLTRLLLWVMGIGALAVGVQAQFFPRTFYNDFPFGRGWVAMDGPFNEHLIRDVGGLNLAIALLTFAALFVSTRTLARVAAAATLVYALPHWIYHLAHLDHMPTADKWGIALSLAPTVLAPIGVLFLVARSPRPRTVATSPTRPRAPATTS